MAEDSIFGDIPAICYDFDGRRNADHFRTQRPSFDFPVNCLYDARPEEFSFAASVVDSYPSPPPDSGSLNPFAQAFSQDRRLQLPSVSGLPVRSRYQNGYTNGLFPRHLGYVDGEDLESVNSGTHYGGSPQSVGSPDTPYPWYLAPPFQTGGGGIVEPLPPMTSMDVLHCGGAFINPREVQNFPELDGQPDLDPHDSLHMEPDASNAGGAVKGWRVPNATTHVDHQAPLSPLPSEADDDPPLADDAADECDASDYSSTARRGKPSSRGGHARRRSTRPRRSAAVRMSGKSSSSSLAGAGRTPRARRVSSGGGSGGGGAGAVSGGGNRGSGRIATAGRAFPCPLAPYGCEATFPSKNEWKRHVGTQHVKLGLWRCTLCRRGTPSAAASNNGDGSAASAHNDFNRKDLFTQHLRRMHPRALARVDPLAVAPDDVDVDVDEAGQDEDESAADNNNWNPGNPQPLAAAAADDDDDDEDEDEDARAARAAAAVAREDAAVAHLVRRCFLTLRSPPARAGCPLCETRFEGPGAWEERIDHLAQHWENLRRSGHKVPKPVTWREDRDLEEYLLEEGLIERERGGGWRIGRGVSRRAKKLGWF